jgi:membrane-associated phospholipid phosphatase
LKSVVLTFTVGPLFYLLVPACGPIYATHDVGYNLVLLHGYPNCFPSLHVATALLFVPFRPKGGLAVAVLFAAATAFTTLATGQHYVIDIVFAVPFAGFAWAAIEGRKRLAAALLFAVLCGAVAIHFI